MIEHDSLKEYLTKKLSGYTPPLPDNDWPEFREKLNKRFWREKVFLNFMGLFLASVLLVLAIGNFNSFKTAFHNKLPGKNRAAYATAGKNSLLTNKTTLTQNSLQLINNVNKNNNTLNKNLKSKIISGLKQNDNYLKENKNHTAVSTEKNINLENKLLGKNYSNSGNIINNTTTEKIISNNADKTLLTRQSLISFELPAVAASVPKINDAFNINPLKSLFGRPLIIMKIVLSPSFSFQSYKINKKQQVHEYYDSIENKSQKAGLSFSEGINVEYPLTRRITITSGLVYNSCRISARYNFKNNKIPVIDSATNKIFGYITDTSHTLARTSFSSVINYQFIEVPVTVNVKAFKFKRFSFGIKAGGSLMYLLSSGGTSLNPTKLLQETVSDNQFNKTNFGVLAGASCIYNINGVFSVGIEPVWSRQLNSIYKKGEAVSVYPWEINLNFSLMMKF